MEILARASSAARKLRCSWASLSCLALIFVSVATAAQQPLEDEVKAAFLLNFTKFVEWPAGTLGDQHSPLTICVLGEGLVADTLSRLVEGELAAGRPIVTRNIKRGGGLEACRVLFIAKSEKEVGRLLAGVPPAVLTVGDSETFIQEGGMIGFVVENRRVRFDINQAAAAKATLLISARLLKVARSVER
jgi:hypothetical protein